MPPTLPLLNALTAHIALLDPTGSILAVNTAWFAFAQANGANAATATGVGMNYLAVCRAVTGEDAPLAAAVATGLAEMLAGQRDTFTCEYACHAPQEQRWFRLRATSLGNEAGVIVVHEPITADKRVAETNAWLAAIVASSDDAIIGTTLEGHILSWNASAERIFGYAAAQAIGQPITLLALPEQQTSAAHMLVRLRHGELIGATEQVGLRYDGQRITVALSFSPIYEAQGKIIGMSIIARDITERKVAEEQLRAALTAEQVARQTAERAVAYITRRQAITAALAGALTRDAVVAVIATHGTVATGASTAVVSLVDAQNAQLTIIGTTTMEPMALADFQVLPLSAVTPATTVVATQTPLWLTSRADAEARFPGSAAIMARLGDHAYALLPLITAGRVIGAISFSYAAPNAFTAEDRTFLNTLAHQCALALERARLYDDVLTARVRLQALSERLVAVQEEERRPLARELHDEIGQSRTGLSLLLSLGPALPPEQRQAQLSAAQGQLTTLIAQVRHRSLDLRPSMLDDLGLRPALAWYLARYTEQTGIALTVQLQGLDERFPPHVELTAYRIVQEALTNVARHAAVRAASVAVWVVHAQLVIEVQDAGRGFDVEAAQRAYVSSGLVGMRERAVLLGGDLTIESTPGVGTTLLANLPCEQPTTPLDKGSDRRFWGGSF